MPTEEITNLATRRGLFFPSAEIYSDAPAGFYDFGPEGTKIKQRITQVWRKMLIENEGNLEIDGSIILPESVFKASGHLENFNDPIVICKACKTPYRADKLLEEHLPFLNTKKIPTSEWVKKTFPEGSVFEIPEGASLEFFDKAISELKIACPKDKKPFGKTQRFNLMMKVNIGATNQIPTYLRPEACQSIFLDFIRIWKSGRVKLPIGIGQMGKAFRNEIAPRQALLRKRELEQMDLEVFFNPKKINEVEKWDEVKDYKLQLYLLKDKKINPMACEEAVNQKIFSGKLIAYWLARTQQSFHSLNIPLEKIRFRELEAEARAFYAKETWDFEVLVDETWVELSACNYRADHDLKMHSQVSKQDLQIKEEGSTEKFFPHIFEISTGVDRTVFAALDTNFRREKRGPEERIYLNLPHEIAPYFIGVFPLMKKDGLPEKAREIYCHLQNMHFRPFYDEAGSIGKRYARIDEIGVAFAITVDYRTLEDQSVTLRERNSLNQKRVSLEALDEVLWKISTNQKQFDDLAD